MTNTNDIISNTIKRIHQMPNNIFSKYIKSSIVNNLIECLNCKYYTEHNLNELIKLRNYEITLLNMNIRSLDKHFAEFMTMMQNLDLSIDIITLSEIGTKNIENRAAIIRNSYNMEYKLPENGNKFGGSCILIKKN